MSNNIEALQLKRDFIFRQIEDYKHSLAETDKELAALKAESEKPREWSVVITQDGDIAPRGYGGDCITVIEKKPIVITDELSQKMINAGRGFVITTGWWVRALKAAGIDATAEARAGDD